MNCNGLVDVAERIHVDTLRTYFGHSENVRLASNHIVALSTTERFALQDTQVKSKRISYFLASQYYSLEDGEFSS